MSRWLVKRYFSKKDLDTIAQAIASSEDKHRAEIRLAIEANLSLTQIITKVSSHRRALDTFSQLRIWDTEENSGVLIYLLLADRKIEIIADRGIHSCLGHDYWGKSNQEIIAYFKKKSYTQGILHGISKITHEMIQLFPKQGDDANELPNEVVIL